MPDKKHTHPSYMRRCVVDVAERLIHDEDLSVSEAVSRAYAICTASMQRAGYSQVGIDGQRAQTPKGRTRQRHFSAMADMADYDDRYERLLALARKDRKGHASVRVRNDRFAQATGADKGEWVELTPADLLRHPEIEENIFDLVDTSYRSIGGHFGLPSRESLRDEGLRIYAVDVDDDPDADSVLIAKGSRGLGKMIALASDGGPSAKQAALTQLADKLGNRGNIIEASGALAHTLITRHGVPYVHRADVLRIMHDKDIEWFGRHPEGKYPDYKGWYSREISGQPVVKIMLGTP